jgi:hypothetical protein
LFVHRSLFIVLRSGTNARLLQVGLMPAFLFGGEMAEDNSLGASAEKLSAAAESLQQVFGKLAAQYESLNQKIDRIIAAVEASEIAASEEVQRGTRKTLSPLVSSLLAKGGVDVGQKLDVGVVEKALRMLSVEQRIAVKAEMARAGLLA